MIAYPLTYLSFAIGVVVFLSVVISVILGFIPRTKKKKKRWLWIIKREMVQYGIGILLISYIFFLWFIWTAYFSGFEITLRFNYYGEGMFELVAMTLAVVPVCYVVKNFKRLYPKELRHT